MMVYVLNVQLDVESPGKLMKEMQQNHRICAARYGDPHSVARQQHVITIDVSGYPVEKHPC